MKISPNLRLLVAVTIVAVVLILDRIPPAEGLKCFMCTGHPFNESGITTAKEDPAGRQQEPDPEEKEEQLKTAMKCTDLTESTKKDETNVDYYKPEWKDPYCITHDRYGRYCTTDNVNATGPENYVAICQPGRGNETCICNNDDFCNDHYMAATTRPKNGANGMSTKFRLVVVTWLVTCFVYFGASGGGGF
ncbi:hypothetical protein Fcan01_27257 [Folsomia candida]|uniref:Uncharacterized protein n=2 Tax=Folsomia candida TaxID=158441 RepID=A0A226CZX0_FOLCA|nr:hypothetical protein Fcan01_27257 [Folsomia candida]